jgi:hypothetical protein
MSPADATSTAVQRLLDHLLDAAGDDPLTDELARWLAGSARFRAFADQHGDKIRKKLRGAIDAEARRDVRAELRAAHLLLGDRRIELAYEAYGANGGPDFTVTYRGGRALNLEVTRLRGEPMAADLGGRLLAKLRQLPPGAPNLLVIAVGGDSAEVLDVAGMARGLRGRADRNENGFLAAAGFESRRAFYDRFLRLGAVLTWCESAPGDHRAELWTNRSARIAVPERPAAACLALLRAG